MPTRRIDTKDGMRSCKLKVAGQIKKGQGTPGQANAICNATKNRTRKKPKKK